MAKEKKKPKAKVLVKTTAKKKKRNPKKHISRSRTDPETGLTPIEAVTCVEYLKVFNQGKAYQRALVRCGQNEIKLHAARKRASIILNKPEAEAYMDKLRANMVNSAELDLERVVIELNKIAFATPEDLFECTTDEEILGLGESLNGFDITVEQDEEGKPVRKIQFKSASKVQALTQLIRVAGGFKDKVEHSGEVSLIQDVLKSIDGETVDFDSTQ